MVSAIAFPRGSVLRTACDNAVKITAPSSWDVASARALRYFFPVPGSARAASFDARRTSNAKGHAPVWTGTESDPPG
jgi:hypothetical protein